MSLGLGEFKSKTKMPLLSDDYQIFSHHNYQQKLKMSTERSGRSFINCQ